MPELPEVESVRQTLLQHLIGRTVTAVSLLRHDVVRGQTTAVALLQGQRISDVKRRGKQLALLSRTTQRYSSSPCICVHLGMTGSLRYVPPPVIFQKLCTRPSSALLPTHTHIVWHFDNHSELRFRDPRRFGWIWTFPNIQRMIDHCWKPLGADAMVIQPRMLYHHLQSTTRALKTTLLDQTVLAGLGNIYVDELLFRCGLHPLTIAQALDLRQVQRLVGYMRRMLSLATLRGGSTVRDYVDGNGKRGTFQQDHCVYGRAGQRCCVCKGKLNMIAVAGRTTVYCACCQTLTAVCVSAYGVAARRGCLE